MIPDGWQVRKLENCLERIIDYRGKAPPKDTTGIPLITARNVRNGFLDFTNQEFIKEQEYDSWMNRGLPKPNDLLFTTEAPLGNVALFPVDGVYAVAQRIITLRPNPKILDARYLLNYLLSELGSRKVQIRGTGSTATGIKQTELRKVPVILPPIQEQRKIADILGTWDEAIGLMQKLIAAKEERKKGLMQRLLTGQVRFPGFERPWQKVHLSEVAQVIMGQSPSSTNYNEDQIGLPLIQGNADISERKTSPRSYTSEITKECWAGDIILSVRAPVGETALSVHHGCLGRGVCAIRPNRIGGDFLYQLLISVEPQWHRYGQGSTFTAINSTDIKNFKFYVPESKEEQQKIAAVLQDCDHEIELLQQKLAALQEQKKGLMQQLLTGQVRVPLEEPVGIADLAVVYEPMLRIDEAVWQGVAPSIARMVQGFEEVTVSIQHSFAIILEAAEDWHRIFEQVSSTLERMQHTFHLEEVKRNKLLIKTGLADTENNPLWIELRPDKKANGQFVVQGRPVSVDESSLRSVPNMFWLESFLSGIENEDSEHLMRFGGMVLKVGVPEEAEALA